MGKLRPSGGYRELRSFQTTTIIYDATYWFCERYLRSQSRMCDQMIQAARSGRQNIAEGSRASATSSQTELRLVNVARGSLEELLLDYEDFLRHRRLRQWHSDSAEARSVRRIGSGTYRTDQTDRTDEKNRSDPPDKSDQADGSRAALPYEAYASWLDHDDPAIRANAVICLIHQANYLLDKQIDALEASFINDGGYSEQLATARIVERSRQRQNAGNTHMPTPDKIPPCPVCSATMVVRTAKQGKEAGKQFFGCSKYPECKGLVKL